MGIQKSHFLNTLVNEEKFGNVTYNQFHNILRLFNVLPNFPVTASETMGDYYL